MPRFRLDLIGAPGRYPALDGIRAVAILLVLGRHATLPLDGSAAVAGFDASALWVFLRNGWLGVDLFFVLSGFLIARTLRREWDGGWRTGLPLSYMKRRMLRTFPLYYAVILLCLFGLFPGYSIDVDRPAYELAVHVVFLQDYLGTQLLTPLWSLATEEKFYLLAPFLAILLWRSPSAERRVILLGTLIALSVGARILSWMLTAPENYTAFFWQVRAPFHGCLDGLLIGVLCFELHRLPSARAWIRRWALPSFVVAVSGGLVLLLSAEWAVPGTLGATVIVIALFSVLCGLAVLAALELEGRVAVVLGSVPLRLLAKLSYALYLAHFTTIELATRMAGLDQTTTGAAVALFVSVYVGLSFLYAILLHLLVERPFLRLKARVPRAGG